jgi:hypothetical protein
LRERLVLGSRPALARCCMRCEPQGTGPTLFWLRGSPDSSAPSMCNGLAEGEVAGLERCGRLTNDPDIGVAVDRYHAKTAVVARVVQHVRERI